jgi:hypothetical protein
MMTENEMVQGLADALGITRLQALTRLEQAAEQFDAEGVDDYDNEQAYHRALATAQGSPNRYRVLVRVEAGWSEQGHSADFGDAANYARTLLREYTAVKIVGPEGEWPVR